MTTYKAIEKVIESRIVSKEMLWDMLMKAYGRYIDMDELEELWEKAERVL